jgi:hypothetical protein
MYKDVSDPRSESANLSLSSRGLKNLNPARIINYQPET